MNCDVLQLRRKFYLIIRCSQFWSAVAAAVAAAAFAAVTAAAAAAAVTAAAEAARLSGDHYHRN